MESGLKAMQPEATMRHIEAEIDDAEDRTGQ